MSNDPIAVAKKSYQAYVDKDRAAIEAVIADDFHFTSPLDNRIDRKTYFERCWPNSEAISGFEYMHLAQEGDRVFVTYEGTGTAGKRFRNTEILTVRGGKIVEARSLFRLDHPARGKRMAASSMAERPHPPAGAPVTRPRIATGDPSDT